MMQPLTQKQQVRLESKMDVALPFVHADPDRILEVLVNLVDNAIKFAPSGGSVVLNASQAEGDPEFAYLSVAETGRGISPAAAPRRWERWFGYRYNSRKGRWRHWQSSGTAEKLQDRLRALKEVFLAVAAGVGESGFYAKRFPLLRFQTSWR